LRAAAIRGGAARVPEGDRFVSAVRQARRCVAEGGLLQLRARAVGCGAHGVADSDARLSRHDGRAARNQPPRSSRAGGGLSVVAASPFDGVTRGEAAALRLKITEIFHSIQGEALYAGWPTVFVRLTGCPLRCRYCDTAYAFGGGEWRTGGEILEQVASFGTRYVCVTGGEPLAQPRCIALLE